MGTRVASVHFPDKNLAGVPQLLEDLQRLAEDHDSADILFLVGKDELPVYAHKIILKARYIRENIISSTILLLFVPIIRSVKYPRKVKILEKCKIAYNFQVPFEIRCLRTFQLYTSENYELWTEASFLLLIFEFKTFS